MLFVGRSESIVLLESATGSMVQIIDSTRSWTIWSAFERSRRAKWDGSSMDSKCRKSFVRSQELSCRHAIRRAHNFGFSVTFGRHANVAETTGRVVHHVRNKGAIAAATVWPFQFRIRASTSAGPGVPRK